MAYLVGGFFSFVGRAIKKVAHVAGKIAGTALGVASVVVPGPAGRVVAGISGKLAGIKSQARRVAAQAETGVERYHGVMAVLRGARPPGLLSKVSPVMPGGAVASVPSLAPHRKRKASRKVYRSHRKRRGKGRKLKFGSPAWRKKYLHKRRRAA